jgi:integrase
MSTDARSSFQAGSYELTPRANGPDAWEFRWRERQPDGPWKPKRKVIGTLKDYPTLAEAKLANQSFVAQINAQQNQPMRKMTVADAWGDFQKEELRNPTIDRSETTIQRYLDDFRNYILPKWGDTPLDKVKAVQVEKWLGTLTLLDRTTAAAPGTKAKIRNHLSALFTHCIRWELYDRANPIAEVRQSAKRERLPVTLDVPTLAQTLINIRPTVIRVMVAVATGSALRRSEVRGLKWSDLDFRNLWFNLQRGLVRKHETKMKTEASRKGLPMMPELAELLQAWRKETPYPCDDDWVFASPYTKGVRPYWPDSALVDYIRPAAAKAGVTARIGWHTFRHSVATEMNNNGANLKTIQEILRHANSRTTLEYYIQGKELTKRDALSTSMSGLFVVPPLAKAS